MVESECRKTNLLSRLVTFVYCSQSMGRYQGRSVHPVQLRNKDNTHSTIEMSSFPHAQFQQQKFSSSCTATIPCVLRLLSPFTGKISDFSVDSVTFELCWAGKRTQSSSDGTVACRMNMIRKGTKRVSGWLLEG